MKIWAHRGCSQRYPENTMLSFGKAIEIEGLTGIELDIQMTKDGELVVIHDETVDRTTNGSGCVKDFTYAELFKLEIETGSDKKEHIPLLEDVLDMLQEKMQNGLLLNIELKNSLYRYEGMEEKVLAIMERRNLQQAVIYSSFYAKSIEKIKEIYPEAQTGILDTYASDCLYKKRGGCGAEALHPFWRGIDLNKEQLKNEIVRAYLSGHLYPEKPTGTTLNMKELEDIGITDIFLNEPERYLK